MKKQIIAVDIDEVLSPLHDVFFPYHNQTYGTNFPVRDPGGSYFIDFYTNETHEVVAQKLKIFVNTDTYRDIKPLDGALAGINMLKDNYKLVILTSRQDFYRESTAIWLQQHFPKVFSQVHFTEHIAGKGPKIPKWKICKNIGADYLIDDSLQTVVECDTAGVGAVLFGDYPWNQTDNLPAGVTRCTDWPAVLEYFDGRS